MDHRHYPQPANVCLALEADPEIFCDFLCEALGKE
jgi:hypothetical protein